MAIIRYKNVGIRAVSACVPKGVETTESLSYFMSHEDIEKVKKQIGILEKRIADKEVCSSDLCLKASEDLMEREGIDREEIDALIFVSQTSDYHQPATAPILQHRLGLGKHCLSFDVNLACSGYVYGLSIAYAFASQMGVRNVLLLVGETMSKIVSRKDKVNTPLFGDAGTATLISKCEDERETVFSLHSDGEGAKVMMVPYGGFRNPSCAEGLLIEKDTDGSERNGEQFRMDGMEVFNFGMREEPKELKELLTEAGKTMEEVDLVLFHQANRFMTDFFAKRLKVPAEKVPYCISKYGNTSSASIPLTMCSEMSGQQYPNRKQVILSGFGAGLSWGSVLVDLSETRINEVMEY